MRTKLLADLRGPLSVQQLAAEAQSLRYWRSNALGYEERVVDGEGVRAWQGAGNKGCWGAGAGAAAATWLPAAAVPAAQQER